MSQKRKSKSSVFFWFYILVGYVCIQFFWWAYLIIDLQIELFEIEQNLSLLVAKEDLFSKVLMIVGEGTVFLILLAIGFYQVRKSFLKEYFLTKQQQDFLLSVTHELNTPLASVKLSLETVKKRKLDDEKKDKLLEGAIRETERLSSLVNNILIATRLDNSSFQFYIESCDAVDIIKSAAAAQSVEKGQEIKFDLPSQCVIQSDKTALSSIVSNLLENAKKYSPSNSVILIDLKENKDSISLAIKDEGIGIPLEEQKNVFQKFYRVGSEATRKTKGTGLGLYLVSFFVKGLNGSISVSNNTPKGSVFSVTIPKDQINRK